MIITGRKDNTSALRTIILPIAIVVVLSVSGYGIYAFITHKTEILPASIETKLSFTPLIIKQDAKDFTASGFKYSTVEDGTQILSYLIHTKDDLTISASEYTQPQQFTEIPEYKDRFLTNVAKQYKTVQTSNGVIYLGRQAKNSNKQLGVMLEKGLIIFLAPNKDLSDDLWRKLGDELALMKTDN